jgi:predicted dehydrogenase
MAPFYNLRVYGTNGTVERDTVAIAGSPEDVHPKFEPVAGPRAEGHPYLPEILDWLAAIRDHRPPRTPLWDGANSTIATLAAVRALHERREVEVPVFGPPPPAGSQPGRARSSQPRRANRRK